MITLHSGQTESACPLFFNAACVGDTFARQPGPPYPPGKDPGGRPLAPQIPQQFQKAPGQGSYPGHSYKANHGKQNAVRQGCVSLIPAVEHGEHQDAVDQRDAQPEFQSQAEQKRQQSKSYPQYHKRHIASPPLLIFCMLP